MSELENTVKAGNQSEIRYLTPPSIETNNKKKFCRFKKYGIKYIDYKDPEFLLKFLIRMNLNHLIIFTKINLK